MKRFGKVVRPRPRPRIIDATYRVVKPAHEAAPDAPPAQPLRPVGSFSELAAKAYRAGRTAGSDEKLNRVA